MNDNEPKKRKEEAKSTSKLKQIGISAAAIVGGLLLLGGGIYGYLYTSTPAHIRNPAYEHYHIRTQIIADGAPIDFSSSDFQEEYDANTCSADLPELPIDFHDGEDQLTHIHWSGITGGELLKYYGWNFIGGEDDSLGRRYDLGMMKMNHVETKGNLFPESSNDSNYYVYVGDGGSYEQKDWNDFLNMDLEEFFGTKSYLNTDNDSSFNILDLFSNKVSAHGDEVDEQPNLIEGENEEEKLERINNLVGNVVIYVQSEEPSVEQIQERFNNLTPLHDSVCGG